MNKENNDKQNQRTTGDLQSLAKSIMPLARQVLGKKGLVEIDILTNWNNIVGEELSAYSLPQRLDFKANQRTNGTLHLIVPSGAFALEIQHREKFILQKINCHFGYNAVSQLRIIQNASLSLQDFLPHEEIQSSPYLVSSAEENYIQDMSEDINHPELKEILIKLGQSIFNDNHIKEKKP